MNVYQLFLYAICLYGGVKRAIMEDKEEVWITAHILTIIKKGKLQ